MKITVKQSEQNWQSPDGQRTIWVIVFENEAGTNVTRKTFSRTISQVGWTGEIIEYTKGTDVYVKQPPKEGYPLPGQTAMGASVSPDLVARLEKAVERLEVLLNVQGAKTDQVLTPAEETTVSADAPVDLSAIQDDF